MISDLGLMILKGVGGFELISDLSFETSDVPDIENWELKNCNL
jgi:hypothetical protein